MVAPAYASPKVNERPPLPLHGCNIAGQERGPRCGTRPANGRRTRRISSRGLSARMFPTHLRHTPVAPEAAVALCRRSEKVWGWIGTITPEPCAQMRGPARDRSGTSLHQRKGQAPPPGKTRGPTSQQRRAPQRTGASHAREPCPAGHARLEHLQDQEPSPRRRRSASFPSHAPHRNWFREVLCLLTVRSSRAKWPPLMVSITSRERLCQPTFPRYDRAASILNRSTKAARRPPSHIRPR